MPNATVKGEIEATVYFETERVDYGDVVPAWQEIKMDTMDLRTLHIFGQEWTERELRLTFGDMGAEALLQLVYNQVEDWEDE